MRTVKKDLIFLIYKTYYCLKLTYISIYIFTLVRALHAEYANEVFQYG